VLVRGSRHTGPVHQPGQSGELLVEFVVPGVPVSAQSKNKERLCEWRKAVAEAAAGAWTADGPLDGDVAVTLVLYSSGYRLDVDNMAKVILDALSGLIWKDDKQVIQALVASREISAYYRVVDVSPVLFSGFATRSTFLHVRVHTPPDLGVPL
jgi:crossover junction endodeoxyribonuclease RusA